MRSILPFIFLVFVLAGGMLSSCKRNITDPPHCDTCCDTCHKPCDTCNKPCDTCNLNKDSLAHAFVWKESYNSAETNLTGVWVFAPTDLIVVGGNLWHFDGTTFLDLLPLRNGSNTPMDGGLSGYTIFAFSKTDYWLVDGNAFHTKDGKHFDDFRPAIIINACWGTKSNDMFFVGNSGNIFHYDGSSFTKMVSNTTKSIGQIWGTKDNNIWAAGFDPGTAESVLLHFDGSIWTPLDLSTIGNIGVARHALGGIWAVDSLGNSITIAGGSLLWRRTNAQLWRSDSGKIQNRFSDGSFDGLFLIRGNSATDFVAAGSYGFISHWNGKTWMRYDNLFNESDPVYITNAISMKDNVICLVGFKDGQSWVAVGTRKQ